MQILPGFAFSEELVPDLLRWMDGPRLIRDQGTSEQIPRGRDEGFAGWDARKATTRMVVPLR
jgi:hypothetical protein